MLERQVQLPGPPSLVPARSFLLPGQGDVEAGKRYLPPRSGAAPESASALLIDQPLLEKPDELCVGSVYEQDTSRVAPLGAVHKPTQAVAERLHRESPRL